MIYILYYDIDKFDINDIVKTHDAIQKELPYDKVIVIPKGMELIELKE